MENLDLLWENALAEIETHISRANFLTFFKSTKLLELSGHKAIVAAPSPMVVNLLQKRFSKIIQEALQKQTGDLYEIEYKVKDTDDRKKTPPKEAPLLSIAQAATIVPHLPRVRPDYTFEALAVSSSNQLAFASATTVAKNIGKSYNPLFIYGPVGVGKTHLMHAIANEVYHASPDKKVIYITSEEFTNEVVEAIRGNETAKMKKRFRSAYLLIIDDIQFIAGKDRVQEELFHTFNILIDNGSQIVLSSDRPPHEIKKLERRLSSRFAGGLTVDIEPPDFELKTAILLKKAEKYNFPLPIDSAKMLAEKAQDVRSLEGLLLRLITQAQSSSQALSTEHLARQLTQVEIKTERLHPDDIIKHVCDFYSLKTTQLKGPKRDAFLVKARQISMYLLKKELGLTFVEIGNLLGGRDHTTIMHGVEKVENLLTTHNRLSAEITGITKTFRG